jgi:hypothetical protein
MTREAPEPKYDVFDVPDSAVTEIDLVIQYDLKREGGEIIEYQYEGRPLSGVVVSYDVLTVSADRVKLDKKKLRVEAEGHVIIEDGKSRTRAERLAVEFKDGKPVKVD